MHRRHALLYVTDLGYRARGRRYGDEDVHLSARLREEFHIALCHPSDVVALMDDFDAVVVRNSGPVLHHREAWESFRARALERGTKVFNQLSGRGDMAGKRYLVELTEAGEPVIPTVDRRERLDRLPRAAEYVVKPELGADSIGMETVPAERLGEIALDLDPDLLVQPKVDFRYEVSFYFVDRDFRYALYAPDPARRWELERYEPTTADLAFARRFVEWNAVDHGIQRVDACRTVEGELLLVELEDLNPYLSLDRVDAATGDAFATAVIASLRALLA
ncbi:hypothetical protein F0L17_02685 [Streptomyces sp. TRM43335]|uniref:ATP-grasp domain-containing protein n=1 Tax=Streptomyces taklimakanensis TaxID=2569853 RepID=A0A6G2B7K2_9ACTN|nr:hypothetical protein [Streptomyces taklimakanensis]MTE18053.1 hypothetical protein [Streptomyces taklimakanensis]